MGNKFHAKKVTIDNHIFDSKLESEYYLYLKELESTGIVKDFEMQKVFTLQEKFIKKDGQVIVGSDPAFNKIKRKYKLKTFPAITYKADFVVAYEDGTVNVIDIKGGILTDTFKLKKKLFEFKYPDLSLIELTKNKKTGEWITFEENKKIKADNKAKRAKKEK